MNTTNHLPSIRNRALLVHVHFSKPQMTKLDRKATADAEKMNNAHGALRAQRLLYPKHLIDPIVAHEQTVRMYVKSQTVPWGDTGLNLLDTTRFVPFAEQIGKYEIERKQLITVFAQNWADVLAKAAEQQGDLFDPSVYPDVSQVTAQFGMRVTYMPVGDLAGGLFTTIETEIAEAVRAEVEASTRSILYEAVRAPLVRLFDSILNIYDKTARPDSRVHASLITDLEEVLALMPALNVLDIPELTALAQKCQEALLVHHETLAEKDGPVRARVCSEAKELIASANIDPLQTLKLDPTSRKQTAVQAAENILSTMKGFF